MAKNYFSGVSWYILVIYGYVWLNLVLFQLLSVLRPFGIFDHSVLLQIINPVVVLIFLIVPGNKYLLVIKDKVQLLLIFGFCAALLVGVQNLILDESRNYFSHVFHSLAGILMYGIGKNISTPIFIGKKYRYACIAILATGIITASITILGWRMGNIARFYTSGYSNLLPLIYFMHTSPVGTFITSILIIISNKRGAYLMAIVVISIFLVNRKKKLSIKIKSVVKIISIILVIFFGYLTIGGGEKITEFYNMISQRLESFTKIENIQDLDVASSGRVKEITSSIEGFTPLDWIIGKGFGFTYEVDRGYIITKEHNIHFTPMTLVVRHGLIYTVVFYFLVFVVLRRSYNMLIRSSDRMVLGIPFYYVLGGLIYSFTAYSVYIDLLFFFMFGHLVTLSKRKSLLVNQQASVS